MKSLLLTLIVALSLVSSTAAQTKKKPVPKKKPAPQKTNPPVKTSTPGIIGSKVLLETKNGDRISGELLDLSAYSIRLRSDQLESTIALATIAHVSFDGATRSTARSDQTAARPEFIRDSDVMLGQFNALASVLKSGSDYTEYGRQLSEVRRSADRFITRYSAGDNPSEARVLSLMAGALTDYTWARTIWTLKFGRAGDGTANEGDSPLLADAVALYPDVRAAAVSGDRLSIDKVIGGLWRKASEKIDRARSVSAPSR
jgi:hypothetical protein